MRASRRSTATHALAIAMSPAAATTPIRNRPNPPIGKPVRGGRRRQLHDGAGAAQSKDRDEGSDGADRRRPAAPAATTGSRTGGRSRHRRRRADARARSTDRSAINGGADREHRRYRDQQQRDSDRGRKDALDPARGRTHPLRPLPMIIEPGIRHHRGELLPQRGNIGPAVGIDAQIDQPRHRQFVERHRRSEPGFEQPGGFRRRRANAPTGSHGFAGAGPRPSPAVRSRHLPEPAASEVVASEMLEGAQSTVKARSARRRPARRHKRAAPRPRAGSARIGPAPAEVARRATARQSPIIAPARRQHPAACPDPGGNADARTGGQRQYHRWQSVLSCRDD